MWNNKRISKLEAGAEANIIIRAAQRITALEERLAILEKHLKLVYESEGKTPAKYRARTKKDDENKASYTWGGNSLSNMYGSTTISVDYK